MIVVAGLTRSFLTHWRSCVGSLTPAMKFIAPCTRGTMPGLFVDLHMTRRGLFNPCVEIIHGTQLCLLLSLLGCLFDLLLASQGARAGNRRLRMPCCWRWRNRCTCAFEAATEKKKIWILVVSFSCGYYVSFVILFTRF